MFLTFQEWWNLEFGGTTFIILDTSEDVSTLADGQQTAGRTRGEKSEEPDSCWNSKYEPTAAERFLQKSTFILNNGMFISY